MKLSLHRPLLPLLAALSLAAVPAHAQLARKMEELEQTKKQIEATRARHAEITEDIERMEREMGALAGDITAVAGQVRHNEDALAEIEEKLAGMEQERGQRKEALAGRRKQVAAMISTLIRVGQMPKESVLLMPVNFVGKVRTARTLSMTAHGLKLEMDGLSLQLAEMKRLETSITGKRTELERKTARLKEKQQELRRVVLKRKGMMESLYSENRHQRRAIAALVEKSENLQTLVNSLEKARKQQADDQFRRIGLPVPKPPPPSGRVPERTAAGKPVREVPASTLALPSLRDAKGRLRMPAGGKVIGGYGQRRGVNDTLKGVEIATRAGAQVVALFDGEVLFTGPFRDYGNMVILRHGDNYHTLLAGLTELDCVPGQRVRGGEPVGLMGSTIEARRLYLELRQDGKPTDPKPWIAGFSGYLAKN